MSGRAGAGVRDPACLAFWMRRSARIPRARRSVASSQLLGDNVQSELEWPTTKSPVARKIWLALGSCRLVVTDDEALDEKSANRRPTRRRGYPPRAERKICWSQAIAARFQGR